MKEAVCDIECAGMDGVNLDKEIIEVQCNNRTLRFNMNSEIATNMRDMFNDYLNGRTG